MKSTIKLFNNPGFGTAARHSARSVVVLVAVLCGLSARHTTGQTSDSGGDVPGAQVLTRGPVHEAFAGIVSYNPEPGLKVEKTPPETIAELPPEVRPEGDNITWIPGYWAWDDERSDFLWISGTWRALPPGREWISGYWAAIPQGYQWTSGYWADSTEPETTYLPRPPDTVEAGPNIAAPSADYTWSPGCWVWHEERYAWRSGYWNEGRSEWEWIPAHYVWTPRGYIFVDGFWDYSVPRRGVVFAPVYFTSNFYSQRGYRYSPSIAINLVALVEHLFLRPGYSHYYFGDYYATSYRNNGFYSSFTFRSSTIGYDPVYSHRRWQHRHDNTWEQRMASSHQDRSNRESARPPRTWITQRELKPGADDSKQQYLTMAAPLNLLAQQKDNPVKFQPVIENERQKLAKRDQEIQGLRDHRRELEATTDPKIGKRVPPTGPTRVVRPGSPIVGTPPSKLPKTQSPPPTQRKPPVDTVRPGPTQVPAPRRPQTEIPTPKGEPRMNDQNKGNPVPTQPPALRPQTEIPRTKGEPRMNDQNKGNPPPTQPPVRRPQTEIISPKGEPRLIEPVPAVRPRNENRSPKADPPTSRSNSEKSGKGKGAAEEKPPAPGEELKRKPRD